MKVIILAAGVGKRLHPLTLNQPKCLVELFGKSILKWQIDVFNHFNITDITIVKGYMEEKINSLLLENGIIVRQLHSYGLPNGLRITIGTKTEMKKTIDVLRKGNLSS